MLRTISILSCVVLLGAFTILAGCGQNVAPAPSSSTEPAPPAATPVGDDTAKSDVEHGHTPGEHGGNIVSIGQDSYHVEAVFEQGGLLRLFVLGDDETKVQEAEAQSLVAYVKPAGDAQATPFKLEPAPQPGDSAGQTSQFVGALPEGLADQPMQVTIPSLRIGGDRYRVAFQTITEGHASAIPDKVAGEEERQLYLTPGGLYTEADIAANGGLVGSQKFAGFVSAHDLHPKPGDRICPVTLTLANPECIWIIGGKEYQFCCPPCVDEFLELAKTKPEAVLAPEEYVKPNDQPGKQDQGEQP